MQHLQHAGGLKCMEVDHFDPRRRYDAAQNYCNLFLASRHCNGAKRDYWPTQEDEQMGIRLLNPCNEKDYDVHIFEDPLTHLLIGITPAGRLQVRVCDLNAPHLIKERNLRSDFHAAVNELRVKAKSKKIELPAVLLEKVEEATQFMIPWIQPPPIGIR